ncbi:unnamed protein product, partial [Effrenium voratum]
HRAGASADGGGSLRALLPGAAAGLRLPDEQLGRGHLPRYLPGLPALDAELRAAGLSGGPIGAAEDGE